VLFVQLFEDTRTCYDFDCNSASLWVNLQLSLPKICNGLL